MKYKVFDYPHRAIRNLMFRVSSGLSSCKDFPEFRELGPLFHDLQFLLDNHLHTENEAIVPYLSPELTGDSDAEHEAIERLQQELFTRLYETEDVNFRDSLFN